MISTMRLVQQAAAWALISACGAAAESSKTLAHFSSTGINAMKVDSSGNIYIAGFQGTLAVPDSYDAFVAKLSPDGSKILYSTTFAGSKSDSAVALDVDSTGAAYISGQTQSPDFPVTRGALQPTMLAGLAQGFVAKVDAEGKVVYATFIGGGSNIYPIGGGLLTDAAGETVVSGQTSGGNFPTTPGAPFTSANYFASFAMKLDPSGGKLLAAMRGIGGQVASDDQGNIYFAGTVSDPTAIPVTKGAFQSTFQLNGCYGTGQVGLACSYQYVTKLNANLTQIVYSTFVTGSFGATAAAIDVDAQGNVLLAGTTNSPDYPTTSDAFQPFYTANAPPGPQTDLFGTTYPPPASGFVTRLNATGTSLVYSTFFSGTQTDTINFAAITNGGIYLSGTVGSPDLPGLDGVPIQCMPQTYETRMSLDGSAVTAARIVSGQLIAFNAVTNGLLAWTGADLISYDPAAPRTPIACIVDAADLRQVSAIAPGELLSIFGARLADGTFSQSPGSAFPTLLGGVTVTINGIASPLLYVAPQQINIQAPYEIGNAAQANLALTSSQTSISDSRTLPVTARNPVAFLDTVTPLSSVDFFHCSLDGLVYGGGPLALAFNSDGSRNTCTNPAKAGSVVRIFLAGLGVTVPPPITGSVNPAPGVPLNLPITFPSNFQGAKIVSATALPGSISGVWQVDLRTPATYTGAIPISLLVDSIPVRDTDLTLWFR